MSSGPGVDFLEGCAELLTGGQDVRVRLRWPCTKGALAQVSRMDGVYYLDFGLVPKGDFALKAFLHELGHIKYDHATESEWPLKPPDSVEKTENWSRDDPLEAEAYKFADHYFELAERLAPGGTFEQKLKAITEFTTRLERIIEQQLEERIK
jgi:hypothetical protein